jgi:alkanesulfonate monooxygenase SsuD/methylene tetrahydromethanopterin reductase-like flavin-dependent oxidoreductase (luciferase family)
MPSIQSETTISSDNDDVLSPKEDLAAEFKDQAQWRREKAKEYPEDADRNQRAALALERLAESVEGIPSNLLEQYELLADEADAVFHNGIYKAVVFRRFNPETATEFIRHYIEQYKLQLEKAK